MTEPDDRELQQYLAGDSRVSRLYREAGHETPPPELDAAVLRRAREAVGRKGGSRRWLPPLALAATVLLGVNLAWNVYEQAPPVVVPQEREVARASAPPEPMDPGPRRFAYRDSRTADRTATKPAAAEPKAEVQSPATREAPPVPNAAAKERADAASASGALQHPAPHMKVEQQPGDEQRKPAKHGWWLAGSVPQDYRIGRSGKHRHAGDFSLMLASADSPVISASDHPPDGFGTVMHLIPAEEFRGHYVMFEAWVRTEGVQEWAGLWLRVDDGVGRALRFDNMHDRGIRGDQDWQSYQIVLDVPMEADRLAFGLLLNGSGQAYIDTARIETVESAHGTTSDDSPAEPVLPPVYTYDFD